MLRKLTASSNGSDNPPVRGDQHDHWPYVLIAAGNHGYLLAKIPGWTGHKENHE